MNRGRLFVISAPSGAGKTTLLKGVMSGIAKMKFSVSHTTRVPRNGEVDGVDYHFVSRETFEKMIAEGKFLEYADVHGNLYGTSHASITEQLANGYDVVLDIDVQGASILRDIPGFDAAFVFISPPSLTELERRLRGRATEDESKIQVRLRNARTELESMDKYDYIIVNIEISEATHLLSSIILAERAKSHRLPSGDPIEKVLQ
ncbi:guanylate kinase [Desulforhopalus sp. IMCC35007]|uniref:guanylate kinase n=1 Tax=Desulforhopalus sp. IMCC35007 TaxID=2569543 RepID=UPI0010AE26EC|nr:guanylate kinase [Desulforhopalus sp. IMCC35007]TKB06722.1 guanylate kinase [Desulforhopalus sp. IMCC35007]